MNFELNNTNLQILQKKNKLYTLLNTKFDKAYFKVSNGELIFALCSNNGIITTRLETNYEGETQYFSLDYRKWQIALQKFNNIDTINVSLEDSLLKLYVEGSFDEINLGTVPYTADSLPAKQIDDFMPNKSAEVKSCNHVLVLTPEIRSYFDLANSLFTVQTRVNSIGVSKTNVMYADKNCIVKENLTEPLSDDLFVGLDPDDNHIYLHTFTVKIMDILKDFNNTFYFNDEYELMAWEDDNTKLVIFSDDKNISLPTDEQLESFLPEDKNVYFDVNLMDLKNSLAFFVGFYSSEAWQPIKFTIEKDKDITLSYNHPTSEITKTLTGVKGNKEGSFLLDSEVLRKIIAKLSDRGFSEDQVIRINYDEKDSGNDAPGVYCTVGNTYEFLISKLLDD